MLDSTSYFIHICTSLIVFINTFVCIIFDLFFDTSGDGAGQVTAGVAPAMLRSPVTGIYRKNMTGLWTVAASFTGALYC